MVDLLTREYEVNYSHIDNRGIAKPSFLWNIMQDAATVHAEALHIGPLDLRIVWVLSRIKARLTRPLLPYERLRCETWCPGIKGASWYRSFSFFVDNKPVGDAQSMWVTLDPETHRIVRPGAFPEAEPVPAHLPRRVVCAAAQAVVRQCTPASCSRGPLFGSGCQQSCQQRACGRADLGRARPVQAAGFCLRAAGQLHRRNRLRRIAFAADRHGGQRTLHSR